GRTISSDDSGMPRDQLAPFWEATAPRGFLGWGKSTQLGSSLGFALGAKLAAPEKLVVQFLGDTALGMCGMDLETAGRERIPILTVLVNNGTMGGYGRHIPYAGEAYRSRYLGGDYTRVAAGPGRWAERGSEPAEITPALRRGGRSRAAAPMPARPRRAGPRWWSLSPGRRPGCAGPGDRAPCRPGTAAGPGLTR